MRPGFLALAALLLTALSSPAKEVREQTVTFGNMKAVYNGNGTLAVVPVLGTDVWDVRVTDAGVWYLDGTLSVAPQKKYAKVPADVKIREVFVDGVIKQLDISFPPGLKQAGFVQNIHINGNVRYLNVKGGDVGCQNAGGKLRVNGRLTNLSISGKTFQNPSGETEYWGGNVWADLAIKDQLQYAQIKGGNLYFDPARGGTHGSITTTDNMRTFVVSSQIVKDKATKASRCYGGVVNCDITSYLHGLKDMQIKGGLFLGGLVRSKFMRTFAVTGFKPAMEYQIPRELCGIRNCYFDIRDYNSTTLNYTNFFVRGVTVKDGNIMDSIITCQGNLRELKASAAKGLPYGVISNTLVRAGYAGPSIDYAMPTISGQRTVFLSTNAVLSLPFAISNMAPDKAYSVFLPQKDLAWSAHLTINGETITNGCQYNVTGTDRLLGTLDWAPSDDAIYLAGKDSLRMTNLALRVVQHGTPELSLDFPPAINLKADSQAQVTCHYYTDFAYEPHKESTVNEKGGIASLSASEAYDSVFAGGTVITDWENPAHASYLGSITTAKFKLAARGNLLLSKAKTAIPGKLFDFQQNSVWANGEQRTK